MRKIKQLTRIRDSRGIVKGLFVLLDGLGLVPMEQAQVDSALPRLDTSSQRHHLGLMYLVK